MLFIQPHDSRKLESLSKRLKLYCSKNYYNPRHDKWKIRSENLKNHLSPIIAKIIMNLDYLRRSKDSFTAIIEEYNNENGTSLIFEDFKREGWIRIIAKQALIPLQVLHYVWDISKKIEEGKEINVFGKKLDFVKCLNVYSKRYFCGYKKTITKGKLLKILLEENSKLDLEYFYEKGILFFNKEKQIFIWSENNRYCSEFSDEIAASIWFFIGKKMNDEAKFALFFEYLRVSKIYAPEMHSYLPEPECNKICELAVGF